MEKFNLFCENAKNFMLSNIWLIILLLIPITVFLVLYFRKFTTDLKKSKSEEIVVIKDEKAELLKRLSK